ncbi:MAG TPA: ABC transporter substrate-binding protein [Xanthobacteraceae bacterium]|nr:ABC transporter substrate-binding protein [Xanthobacteraceae bacterium]
MKRREFMGLLGRGALVLPATGAWPRATLAQTADKPVIGLLHSVSASGPFEQLLHAFRDGLGELGFVEGRNLTILYRWAEGKYDRLPGLAAELVDQKVRLIAATGGQVSARAAMKVTSTIPILFIAGFDPVSEGFVTSMNRPGGNATGFSVYTTELIKKRLELLRNLVPGAKMALLMNPKMEVAPVEERDTRNAAREQGVELVVLGASAPSEFGQVFAAAAEQKVGALLVSADPFLTGQRNHIVALAAQHKIPAAYPWREYALAGGLMSYGPRISEAYRWIGRYAGRILKGEKPGDLPVQLPREFDLVLNLKTAKALGLSVPYGLLATANETIE